MKGKQKPTDVSLGRFEESLTRVVKLVNHKDHLAKRKFGLDSSQRSILVLLKDSGPLMMKDIGNQVEVKLSNLTNLVDRLEKNKWVKRVKSPEDRRSVHVRLTPKGEQHIGACEAFMRELTRRMTETLEADKFGILLEGIERVTQVPLNVDDTRVR